MTSLVLKFTLNYKFYLNPHIVLQTADFDKNSKYSIISDYLFRLCISY